MFVNACDICQGTKIKSLKNRLYHLRIPVDYSLMECFPVHMTFMPNVFNGLKYLPVVTHEITNLILKMPIKARTVQVIAEVLIHRLICIFYLKTSDSTQRFSIYSNRHLVHSLSYQLTIVNNKAIQSR